MIVVVAALEFSNQADRDEAVRLTADVQRLTREEEPGCHDYCFAPDPAIPTRMQVYELWENSESLAAHFQHPYYDRMAGLLQGVGIVSSTNQAYLVERGEPVYNEKGEKKTGFFLDWLAARGHALPRCMHCSARTQLAQARRPDVRKER